MAKLKLTGAEIVAASLAILVFVFAVGLRIGMDSRRPNVVISAQQTEEDFSRLSEPDRAEELPAVTLKVNINTATAEELTLLDGIGPTLAERIITYRRENGEFKKAEDIMNVSGIGSGTFGKIYDRITVD